MLAGPADFLNVCIPVMDSLLRHLDLQELGKPQNGIERRPQFMAHGGQEHALRPASGFCALTRANQLGLVTLLLGNLLGNSDYSYHFASLVANGKSPAPHPFLNPIWCANAVFNINNLSPRWPCGE